MRERQTPAERRGAEGDSLSGNGRRLYSLALFARPPMQPPATRRAALAILRRAYANAPASVRLHVVGRFLSCPMLPVLAKLPGRGRLLDLGAGHGAFALLAVATGAAESAVAIEPDFRKLLACSRVSHPRVHLLAGYADVLHGRFAAVSVLDVLYRLPIDRWDPFLAASRDALEPGGLLLLKEIDPTHRLKGAWNRWQERGADVLGLTLGDAFSYEPPAALATRLARMGFGDVETMDLGTWFPHAHVLYLARRS